MKLLALNLVLAAGSPLPSIPLIEDGLKSAPDYRDRLSSFPRNLPPQVSGGGRESSYKTIR